MKLVSVLMSIFNEDEQIICEAVNSILNQTYKELEFIIIIDNPNHSSLESILERFSDPRIKVILNNENVGLALSLNKAASIANGYFFVRMDADDISEKERIEVAIDYMNKHTDCGLVCSNAFEIDEDGNLIDSNFFIPPNDYSLKKSLDYGSLIIHPTVVMRREAFEACGGYNDYLAAQDYDLWLKMRDKGIKMHFMNQKLLRYRRRRTSVTSEKNLIQCLSTQYAIRLNKKHENFSKEQYMNYISKQLQNSRFVKDYISFMKAKELRTISDYFFFIRGIIFNSSCRYKLKKRLFFILLCS